MIEAENEPAMLIAAEDMVPNCSRLLSFELEARASTEARPSNEGDRKVVWGVSFDATPISGVVVEFIKLARIFREHGYRIHLDLGYDIKEDKNNFFKPYGSEAELFPTWVNLDRIDGLGEVESYDQTFVREILRRVAQGREAEPLLRQADTVSQALSCHILQKWQELGVSFVIVENGTLSENIAYTKALYMAIEEYGRANRLGCYVLWRDHDMMWSSEPGIKKYGEFPYLHAVKPSNSPFIHYIALHDEARRRTLEWAPHLENIETLHNTFTFAPAVVDQHNAAFRRHFHIPEDAFLIARFTRIIPQKGATLGGSQTALALIKFDGACWVYRA
ncbi:MAG: hypothetical protein LC776_00190 [Acidobacteria bacterium]|nr:hypothetical protein [Acidobacteriota bacterium]